MWEYVSEITSATILEWLAFSSSMTCVFFYGYSKKYGAIIGIITAFLFIAWGIVAELYAAGLSNIIFAGLHIKNLRRALKEQTSVTFIRNVRWRNLEN